jgi:hypothetical protein
MSLPVGSADRHLERVIVVLERKKRSVRVSRFAIIVNTRSLLMSQSTPFKWRHFGPESTLVCPCW